MAAYNPKRILVIGGVSAGPSAAAKAARTDPEAEVVLLEQGHHISYGVCELPYVLSGELKDFRSLLLFTPDSLKEKKSVTALIRHRVERIHPAQKRIEVRDLETNQLRMEAYDKLIMGTGCRPRELSFIPPSENVFHLKTIENLQGIQRYIDEHSAQSVCIVGAGFIGLEAAEAFHQRGLRVTLVYDDRLPLPYLDTEGRRLLERILTEKGIALFPNQDLRSARQAGSRISALSTADKDIEADLFLIAIGFLPNIELARDAGIRLGNEGAILTDQRQMTNIDGIYAAGDCTEVLNVTTRRTMMLPFASVASRTGRIAGENAAGGSAQFRGCVPMGGLSIFGYEFGMVGTSTAMLEASGFRPVREHILSTTRVSFMPESQPIFVSLSADARTHQLLNANIIAPEHAMQRANVLALAIRQQLTVEQFLDTDFVYTPRSSPLWDPLLTCASQLLHKLRR